MTCTGCPVPPMMILETNLDKLELISKSDIWSCFGFRVSCFESVPPEFVDGHTRYNHTVEEEQAMGEVVHTSRIKIVREKGPTRRAMIEGFDEPVYYGVHGGIKRFYKVEPEKEHAATLDHIVAATAG
jgi:hypothetical protein